MGAASIFDSEKWVWIFVSDEKKGGRICERKLVKTRQNECLGRVLVVLWSASARVSIIVLIDAFIHNV